MNKEISSFPEYELPKYATWADVEAFLRPFATAWVSRAAVPTWRGQEEDIIEDVVQETIVRTLRIVQSAERGERPPISDLRKLSGVILRNYINDLMRRARRLSPLIVFDADQMTELPTFEDADFSEKVIEDVTNEELFRRIARLIVNFPPRMGSAMLIDLANRMDFGDEETPLQKAFQEVGVRLEDYRKQPSEDRAERNRQAALLSMGYKKIAREMRAVREEYFS